MHKWTAFVFSFFVKCGTARATCKKKLKCTHSHTQSPWQWNKRNYTVLTMQSCSISALRSRNRIKKISGRLEKNTSKSSSLWDQLDSSLPLCLISRVSLCLWVQPLCAVCPPPIYVPFECHSPVASPQESRFCPYLVLIRSCHGVSGFSTSFVNVGKFGWQE